MVAMILFLKLYGKLPHYNIEDWNVSSWITLLGECAGTKGERIS